MYKIIIENLFFIGVIILLSIPLGIYIYKVMNGERVWLTRIMQPLENTIYRFTKIDKKKSMRAKTYIKSVLIFSFAGFIVVFLLQIVQGYLPFNPQKIGGVSLDLAFNTAASFVSNTNWQAYAGETTLSYFTQAMGLTVQNFVSAATGIAVVFALIRGFVFKEEKGIGNFWVDLTRVTLYVLLPLAFVVSILLIAFGVMQNFLPYQEIVSLDGGGKALMSMGPAASQIAIKQLGTNGGGFFGLNSAFPLENPNAITNFIQVSSILLIPASLCVSLGKAVKDYKQGIVLYAVMMSIFILALIGTTISELNPSLMIPGVLQSGNMIGKEAVHGIGGSSLWTIVTTAASNGSVNSMLTSYTPIGGLFPMFLMQLGEIVFGGVGSGLYGMIAFVILTVFIAGLMVGRTPEYLGKKIEPYDMKMVCTIILIPPVLTLVGTALTVLMPAAMHWISNSSAHGFSEVLYGFSSMGNNNGSAFTGLMANTPFINILGGFIMLIARFVPMVATLLLAGNLAKKKHVPNSEGTLETTNVMFYALLLGVIIIVGALSFLPALSLGPIAEQLSR